MTDNKKTWYKRWWAITLFIFFGIVIIANLGEKPTDPNVNTTEQTAQVVAEQNITVFDVEALYGKNIDNIRAVLGKPTDGDYTEPNAQQLQLGTTEWNNTFKKDEYELLVTYDVKSREVIDFFVGTDDPSGATKNIEKLEKVLNVQNSSNFTIKPVKNLKDPSVYTGIIVRPKK
jgi:hypothetical protein